MASAGTSWSTVAAPLVAPQHQELSGAQKSVRVALNTQGNIHINFSRMDVPVEFTAEEAAACVLEHEVFARPSLQDQFGLYPASKVFVYGEDNRSDPQEVPLQSALRLMTLPKKDGPGIGLS